MHRFMNHLDDLAGLDMIVSRKASDQPRRATTPARSMVARLRALWAPREAAEDRSAERCRRGSPTEPARSSPQKAAHVLPFPRRES